MGSQNNLQSPVSCLSSQTTALHRVVLARLRKPVPVGVGYQLEAIGEAELGEDRREVMDHCGLADRQAIANLPVFQTLANQLDDLTFAFGQRGDLGRLGVGADSARARSFG